MSHDSTVIRRGPGARRLALLGPTLAVALVVSILPGGAQAEDGSTLELFAIKPQQTIERFRGT